MNKYRITYLDDAKIKELEIDAADLDDAIRRGRESVRQKSDGRRTQILRIERVTPSVLPPVA